MALPDNQTIFIECPKCGREIELNYDWMVAFYVGECPYCHKQMGEARENLIRDLEKNISVNQ